MQELLTDEMAEKLVSAECRKCPGEPDHLQSERKMHPVPRTLVIQMSPPSTDTHVAAPVNEREEVIVGRTLMFQGDEFRLQAMLEHRAGGIDHNFASVMYGGSWFVVDDANVRAWKRGTEWPQSRNEVCALLYEKMEQKTMVGGGGGGTGGRASRRSRRSNNSSSSSSSSSSASGGGGCGSSSNNNSSSSSSSSSASGGLSGGTSGKRKATATPSSGGGGSGGGSAEPFPKFAPDTLRSLKQGSSSDAGLKIFIDHLSRCRTKSGLLEVKHTAKELVRQSQRLFADIESLAQPEGNSSEEEHLTQPEPGFWVAYYKK